MRNRSRNVVIFDPKLSISHTFNSGIVLRAFVALSNLVDTPQPQIQRSIRDAGVVNRFVSFLKSQTPMLYTEGCKGIRRMSVRAETREEIHMAGGVAALVAGCTREDAEGRVNCLGALENFAVEGALCGEEILFGALFMLSQNR